MDKERILGTVALLLASLIWGATFPFQREAMQAVTPLFFTAVRFSLATLVMAGLWQARRTLSIPFLATPKSKLPWKTGAVAGVFLSMGICFQQIGLIGTESGKAGFLTGLYLVWVPLIVALRTRKISLLIILATILSLFGTILLSQFHLSFQFNPYDLWILACSVGWACQILWLDHNASQASPLGLALVQFFVCAGVSWLCAMLFEPVWVISLEPYLVRDFLFTGVLATCLAFTLQIVGQARVPASIAVFIMNLESVFAVFFGWMMSGETLNNEEMKGCFLIFIATWIAQLEQDTVSDH